jgi:tetratricopeptide (TPR) repeat protein
MDRETRAMRSISEADMEIRRGQLEEAEETLVEAEVLTTVQQDGVALLRSGIEEKRLEDMYLEARGLSDDYRYPEAVAAYDRLLATTPEYKDAVLRKATLEEFMRMAEEFYAKAVEAEDDAVAEEYLRAIQVIWPEYRDVVQRLEAIEARKAAKKDGDAGPRAEGGG